jgi:putative peptidoglycan lipid II flippase
VASTGSGSGEKTGRHAFSVASAILVSRVAGFLRESLLAQYLGTSIAAAAVSNALRIPNVLQNLLGEGVLSASFIPVHARLVAEGDEESAGRVSGIVGALLALLVAMLVLVGVVFAPAIVSTIAWGLEGELRDMTVRLVRIIFPGTGFLVMSAWCLGILNSRRRFFLSYVAPVAWNAAMIAALLVAGQSSAPERLALWVAWGSVAGSIGQLLMQLPHVLRLERRLAPGFDWRFPPVLETLRNVVPVIIGRGVSQISSFVDVCLSSMLPHVAQVCLPKAQMVYLLPISLFGMSIAASELPEMSSLSGSPEALHAHLRARLERSMRRVAFLVVPTVVAFALLGRILLAAYLERGEFKPEATRYTWYILLGSTVGLLAATLGRLCSSAFYALRDTRTPLRVALVRLFLTAGLGALFAFPLRPLIVAGLGLLHLPMPAIEDAPAAIGACGLTLSAGIAGWVEYLLLSSMLRKRIGPFAIGAAHLARLWASALAGGVAAVAMTHFAGPPLLAALPHFLGFAARAIVACAAFGVVYWPLAGGRVPGVGVMGRAGRS